MKYVTVPIFNHEYKVVVCWGDVKYLKKLLEDYHYEPDTVTNRVLQEETEERRGVTFHQHRCYSVIWVDADLPVDDAIGTLAHEAVHAVDYTFDAIGENVYHSEVFAHSVGAIVRESIKAMNLFRKEKKCNTQAMK